MRISDWSSDVCSSDLPFSQETATVPEFRRHHGERFVPQETQSPTRSKPLAGVRVVDIATYIAAPYCATVMAEFGAEVIKVELPKVGDPCRRLGSVTECGDTDRKSTRLNSSH